jgi:hypothetical protein
MIRVALVYYEPRIAEVVATTLRGLGARVSQVYPWDGLGRVKATALGPRQLVIVPVAVGMEKVE